jgi:4'-phosphopantetheinyl transferase
MPGHRVALFVERDPVDGGRGHDLLRRAVTRVSETLPEEIREDSTCDRCGAQHGKPTIVFPVPTGPSLVGMAGMAGMDGPDGSVARSWQVSISRCPGVAVVAVSDSVVVGVDVESIERLSRASIDAVAFHPDELAVLSRLKPDAASRARTILWTRKEAVLKASGHGLRIDPTSLHISVPVRKHSGPAVVREWPPGLAGRFRAQLAGFELDDGCVGTIAALTDRPISIEVIEL